MISLKHLHRWMDHPSIARIVDAGITEQGQPFFAMELVKGLRVTEYCDVHRTWATDEVFYSGLLSHPATPPRPMQFGRSERTNPMRSWWRIAMHFGESSLNQLHLILRRIHFHPRRLPAFAHGLFVGTWTVKQLQDSLSSVSYRTDRLARDWAGRSAGRTRLHVTSVLCFNC